MAYDWERIGDLAIATGRCGAWDMLVGEVDDDGILGSKAVTTRSRRSRAHRHRPRLAGLHFSNLRLVQYELHLISKYPRYQTEQCDCKAIPLPRHTSNIPPMPPPPPASASASAMRADSDTTCNCFRVSAELYSRIYLQPYPVRETVCVDMSSRYKPVIVGPGLVFTRRQTA